MRQFLVTLVAFCFMVTMSVAQTASVSLGTDDHDSSVPVEVSADSLEIDQDNGVAVFTGNVVITQDDLKLTAPKVRITYDSAEGGSGDVEHMHATGGVTMISPEEVVEAREAVFSVVDDTVVMTGDVIMTQGDNAIAGERLDADLDAGTGVLTGGVRMIFTQDDKESGN